MKFSKIFCCGSKEKFPNTKNFQIKISFNPYLNYYDIYDQLRSLIKKNFPNSEILKNKILSQELNVILKEKIIFEFRKNTKNQILFKNSEKKNFLNKILTEIS